MSRTYRTNIQITLASFCVLWALVLSVGVAHASIAYGTLNNFDCVNDTGVEAHGFEIELDDVQSKDITYTYDYNHYGVPKIREDYSNPGHTNVFIRYASAKNPDGTWAAYTAIPSGPITPTQGHQFTNPSINFGGEHFGAGFYGSPTAVKYNWLIDDGTGNLVHGPPVYVATPTFVYNPPVAQVPAFVQAVVVPPPPPALPVWQFGEATWVKAIKTTTHNANKVELAHLVDPDPDNAAAANWANGEPAEVEMEWKLLQTEFANPANPKGVLQGANEDLPGGDEIITRRYEFYKYTGPKDQESGEAMADTVAANGTNGVGTVTYNDHIDPITGEWVTVTVDTATLVIVGDFFGAQMSGFDVVPALGLIDHIPDGELNVAYAERTVVVPGANTPFHATTSGSLPDGTTLDEFTGVFKGTPTVAGVFTFTVDAKDLFTDALLASKTYTVTIPGVVPVTSTIATSASPVEGGTTTGDGVYDNGTHLTVVATHNPGYAFVNWSENAVQVSDTAVYPFTVNGDRTLVANFTPAYTIVTSASPIAGGTTSGDGTFKSGDSVTVLAAASAGYSFVNWTEGAVVVSGSASYTFTASANRTLVANFVRITFTIATSASPVAGGTTSGGGTYNSGDSVTVVALANAGYSFVNWTEGAVVVSGSASYTFTASANRTLVANFVRITFTIGTSASPLAGGTTSGGGTYNSGDSATVIASANAGYSFLNWTEGAVVVSASASYTFTASANRTLVANFVRITYTIGTSASPLAGGTTSGGGTYNSGDSATVIASANAGYSFLNWTEGAVVVSTSASYTFTASANRNLVANFTRITYTIGTSASPVAGGTTSGGGTYNSGDSVTVVASANPGYSFLNWTEGAVVAGTSASYTFTANANRSLVANFVGSTTITITTCASPATGGTTSGGGTFNSGDSVTVIAKANLMFVFVNWTEGGVPVSESASYTFPATANRSLVANFVLNGPVLQINAATATRNHGKVDVVVVIRNTGARAAQAVAIVAKKDATLSGKKTNARTPVVLGTIAPGGTAAATLTFPGVQSGIRTLRLKLTHANGMAILPVPVSVP